MSHQLLVRARGVSIARGALSLLSELDLDLHRGCRLGVIGENGAGKSTLLAVLLGDLAADHGTIDIADSVVRIMCRQNVEHVDNGIIGFANSHDLTAHRWRKRLGLHDDDLARWPTLSPGERRRWQIGAALAAEPDLLLLDEPTDHLDTSARRVLVEALRTFTGALVVVSHDRSLLDGLTTSTLRLHRGHARAFDVGIAATLQQLRDDEDRAVDERDAARHKEQRAGKQLAEAKLRAQDAERGRSARTRMRNENDSEARGILAQNMADWASARLSRTASVIHREHDRAVDVVNHLPELDKRVGRDLHFDFVPLSRPRLCVFAPASVVVAGDALNGPATLVVARDARIRIHGDNGAGKSTLLAALVKEAGEVPGLVVIPQHLDVADEASALQAVRALPTDVRGRTLQLLAALGVDPQRILSSTQPSSGEARKLLLATALTTGAQALVLDEPTNHLDLPSVQRLEEALRDYPGALVVVSHDDAFSAAIRLTTVWRVVLDQHGRSVEVDDVSVGC